MPEGIAVGDVVFLANADTAHVLEHVVLIDSLNSVPNHRVAKVSKAVTVNKIFNNDGSLSIIPVPFFGLVSNQSNLIGTGRGEMFVNIDSFDIVGKVTKKAILDLFNSYADESLIKFKPVETSILG